ncbi:bacillithiol biosynthesis deacetylase BshB2 [Scopulibacillus darangshiensis]|uniref:Bacillithiol biosynthesis deacetylase BshB2 n=1 Tax=Scopulibacillus darangshiensis TaxID=442528 RepID=A0A4R2NI60_9BACL|nr:bacillithiol biosynthesis deacetylase BshB2 [Scopulibacillus darangshiensis]TCP20875.1 bacillithiol biosynthesis deacetylase BshB2 [Scopulibacillus darangshiensis]
MQRPVLVVFPHPDDEAFGVSGSISKFTNQGIPVTYICMTLGEMGRNMGKPTFATRESLPHIRRSELEEACRLAGIKDLRRFGLRDKTVEFEDQEQLADRVLEVIKELDPQLIITFYPGYSVHPDHDACGAAVIRAARKLPEKERPVINCIAFAHNTIEDLGEPDVKRDVSDVIDQKLSVLQAHRSQTEAMVQAMKEQIDAKDPEVMGRFITEKFWTYKW